MRIDLNKLLDFAIVRGFDASSLSEGTTRGTAGAVHIRCTQCDALVINGTATHEQGCPNQRHECRECDTLIPRRQTYCESCWAELFGGGDVMESADLGDDEVDGEWR